jgi:TPR repeat protein
MDFENIDYSEMDGDEIYDYGCDFLDDGDVDNALKCFILAAEKDDVSAQSQLGDMYRGGKWVEASLDEAIKWYKLAAENGDRDAIYYLGYLFYRGDDVEQDYKEAYYWFSKDDFYDIPNYIRGDMYFHVDQNYELALACYRKSLKDDGYAYAAYKIGEMYYYGLGLEQSYDEAVKYLKYFEDEFDEMFADEAPAKVHYMLAEMYKNGWGVEQDIGLAEKLLKAAENSEW